MASKCLLLALLVATVQAGLLPHQPSSQPWSSPSGPNVYNYDYSVADPATGNFQDKYEAANGDHVSGRYSVVEPDGYRRTVTYTVQGDSGFLATVRRDPSGISVPQPTPSTGYLPSLPHHPSPPHWTLPPVSPPHPSPPHWTIPPASPPHPSPPQWVIPPVSPPHSPLPPLSPPVSPPHASNPKPPSDGGYLPPSSPPTSGSDNGGYHY